MKFKKKTCLVVLFLFCLSSCYFFFSEIHRRSSLPPVSATFRIANYTKRENMSRAHPMKRSLQISSDTNSSSISHNVSCKTVCTDRICSNLLSIVSYQTFEAIQKKCNATEKDILPSCSFRNGSGIEPVALVSRPGSGNTWVRGLLEKATGICTGAVFRDCSLWKSGFVGEGVHDGSVIAIKTHAVSNYNWMDVQSNVSNSPRLKYVSAILLIRNPFNALVAERNRVTSRDHVNFAIKSQFGENPMWNNFVQRMGEKWRSSLLNWLISAHQLNYSLIVIRYEDLKEDKVEQVSRMLDFLHQDYNRTELAAKLLGGYNQFHRQHTQAEEYDHYTHTQRVFVNSIITSAMEELQSAGINYKELKLNEYLELEYKQL